MDYLPPVACVELSGGRYFICLIDINGAADLPRQLGGWTADRNDHQLLSTLLTGRLVIKANGQAMEEVDQAGIAGYFTFETSFSRLEAQLEILQSRFEAALGAPERRGLAALTEPRWPRLDRDAFLSPNPQSSIEGSGRAAFSVGVAVKNLADTWGRLESIRLTASYPLPKSSDSPAGSPRQFRHYLNDDSPLTARPLPVGDR